MTKPSTRTAPAKPAIPMLLLHTVVLLAMMLAGLSIVRAQQRDETPAARPALSPAAMEALERLVGRPVAGTAAGPSRSGTRDTVTVQRGETLDAVMRRTMKDTPFRDEALRKAFVTLNPNAFAQGSPHRLQAGASLRVPTLDDVLASANLNLVSARAPAPSVTPPPEEAHRAAAPGPDPRVMERKHWVRYP